MLLSLKITAYVLCNSCTAILSKNSLTGNEELFVLKMLVARYGWK